MSSKKSVPAMFLVAALYLPVGAAYAQLGPPPQPAENTNSEQKRILGKILFWDEQLSSDDTVACGTCHIPAAGGSDPRLGNHPGPDGQFGTADDTIGSPGIVARNAQNVQVTDPVFGDGLQVTPRGSPGIFMSMYAGDVFWDGRARTRFEDPQNPGITVINAGGGLESQAVGPILSAVEMAHRDRDWTEVIDKLAASAPLALAGRLPQDVASRLSGSPSYPTLFADAFGDPTITAARIGMAIAAYERTLVPDQTPWDRFMRGEQNAMTPEQLAGWQSFEADTVCDNCHTPPHFTDHQFYNIGLRPAAEDTGREKVTLDAADHGRFKTPTLRNVGLRKAMTHVGWVTDLQDAVDFYNASSVNNRHQQFTAFQSEVPAPGGGVTVSYALVTFFPDDPVGQAPVLDFLANALTDPRAANESFPFDRPLLRSEQVAILSYDLSGSAWTPARADLIASIIAAEDPDVVALQGADSTAPNSLTTRLGDRYSVAVTAGSGAALPILYRRDMFELVDTGARSSALACDGNEVVGYAELGIRASMESLLVFNTRLCPPDLVFPATEATAFQRNEATAVLLAEMMLSGMAGSEAPAIAVGNLNATDSSSTIAYLTGGAAVTYADGNPMQLADALRALAPGSAGLADTEWALATDDTTGITLLDASVVSNANTTAAGGLPPVSVRLAVDTTPVAISASPGNPGDTTPPSTPPGLTTTSASETSIDLSWNASSDDVGVSRYRVSRNGNLLATTTSRSYSDGDVIAATSYTYVVTAMDESGNESGPSTVTATASSAPPPPPPPPTSSGGGGSIGTPLLAMLLFVFFRRRIADAGCKR